MFRRGDKLYRALAPAAWEAWKALRETEFLERSTEAGQLVRSREVSEEQAAGLDAATSGGAWAGVLEHEVVPFITYPYEWSFHMLRRAALLQLDLHLEALKEGLTLKDASTYNLQWRGAKPVFIDIGSFEPYEEGEPWVGYLQFCQLFLFPLLLTSLKGVPFHSWLRGSVDGISPRELAPLMSFRDRFRHGVFAHVYLHAKLQQRSEARSGSVKKELRQAGFSEEILRHNLRRMRRLVEGLEWQPEGSTWADYAETGHSYDEADLEAKRGFVRAAAERAPAGRWGRVWDLGANTGRFSEIAAEHADTVLAMDGDHLAVDRLFQRLEKTGAANILPLVMDLGNPSPGLGWRGRERGTLTDRGKPDLVLSLALIHHLAISAHVPLPEILDWFADLGGHLVIEFVDKQDPMVQRLLQNKADIYRDYSREAFEAGMEQRFEILDRADLASGTRSLVFARPRT